MSNVADFLEQKQREITGRLAKLRPTVEEYERLQAAAAALGAIPAAPDTTAPDTKGAGRRRRGRRRRSSKPASTQTTSGTRVTTTVKAASKKAARRKARGGRRESSARRSGEALALVQGQPGITIRELATKMGITSSYLYRVLPGLEKEGKIRKDGRGWQPSGS